MFDFNEDLTISLDAWEYMNDNEETVQSIIQEAQGKENVR